MQEHAGAGRRARMVAFEVCDVVSQPPQMDGCGNSADAIAENGDPERVHSTLCRILNAAGATGGMPLRGGSPCGVWIFDASPSRPSRSMKWNPRSICPGYRPCRADAGNAW